jgi:hypothetical protein
MTASGARRMTESVMISVLNNASLDAFNTFAAGLEGFSEHDAMTKTALRNLPWWLQSFWLPIEFDPPKELASDKDDPTFVGSSIRLLNKLTKIKEMSSLMSLRRHRHTTTCGMIIAAGSRYRTACQRMTRSDGFGTRFVMVRRFQSRGNFR